MRENSIRKAKLNISTTLLSQLIATACGIVIPRAMIASFGSAVYGLTTSIAQFLSYISLLDAGIARVARGEMYKPLAERNFFEVSRVYHAIRHFFMNVGIIFLAYTLLLSFTYYDIAGVSELNRNVVFFLVWIISMSTLAKYLGGISNLTLINSDQKQYISNLIIMSSTIANAVLVVVLTQLDCDIIAVKLGSSLAYLAQPLCYMIYVKRHYQIVSVGKDRSKLEQKWTGLGQHMAYFLHNNIDVVLLTLFADIRLVAVYSVYKLVISSVRKIVASFTGGMEASFGEMIAREENESLRVAFRGYKIMLSTVAIVLFGTTAVLVVPFVRLYTAGITDADYIQPAFALVLLFAEMIDCVMHPCASLPVSANRLKESRWGSYGEAAINVVLSIILIQWRPLLGIAIGTLVATTFKAFYYMHFSAVKILKIKMAELVKNFVYTNALVALYAAAGMLLIKESMIRNYFHWAIWGFVVVFAATAVTAAVGTLLYPAEIKLLKNKLLKKFKKFI